MGKGGGRSLLRASVVYADIVHVDPWFLMVSAGLAEALGDIVAGYGQRFTCEESDKNQKNDPGKGLHLDCVKLGNAERWDGLWLVFAWAYYWLNVAGWDVEIRDLAHWRANTAKTRTHTLWRLGLWALNPRGAFVVHDMSTAITFHPTHPAGQNGPAPRLTSPSHPIGREDGRPYHFDRLTPAENPLAKGIALPLNGHDGRKSIWPRGRQGLASPKPCENDLRI